MNASLSGIKHTSMARISSIRVRHDHILVHYAVHTSNLSNSEVHRGQRTASASKGAFGETWMLAKRRGKTTTTELSPVTLLLVRPTEVPDECEKL